MPVTLTAVHMSGSGGRNQSGGAGLADAYGGLTAETAPLAAVGPRPIERINTGAR